MKKLFVLLSLLILSVSVFANEDSLLDQFVSPDETQYSAIYKPDEGEALYTVLIEKKYNPKYAETLNFQVSQEKAEELYSMACKNANYAYMFDVIQEEAKKNYKLVKSSNSYDTDHVCWRTYYYMAQ